MPFYNAESFCFCACRDFHFFSFGFNLFCYRERFLRGAPQVDYDPRGEDMPLMKELRRQMECLKKR